MKLSTLMTINALIAAVFGIAFVLVPWQIVLLYGLEPSPPLIYLGRLFGTALVTFALLTWSARNSADSEARKAIILALFVGDAVGFIVALVAQLGGVVNTLGWSTVAIYLLLTIGFGYFQFSKQTP